MLVTCHHVNVVVMRAAAQVVRLVKHRCRSAAACPGQGPTSLSAESEQVEGEDPILEVEKIVSHTGGANKTRYLTKWKGSDTMAYEPAANFKHGGHDGFDIAYDSFLAPCQESLMRHVGSPMEPRVPRSRRAGSLLA